MDNDEGVIFRLMTKMQKKSRIQDARVVSNIANSAIFMRHESPHWVRPELAYVPALHRPILTRGGQILSIVRIPSQRLAVRQQLGRLHALIGIVIGRGYGRGRPRVHQAHPAIVPAGGK